MSKISNHTDLKKESWDKRTRGKLLGFTMEQDFEGLKQKARKNNLDA